jgi:hypothetical protein
MALPQRLPFRSSFEDAAAAWTSWAMQRSRFTFGVRELPLAVRVSTAHSDEIDRSSVQVQRLGVGRSLTLIDMRSQHDTQS